MRSLRILHVVHLFLPRHWHGTELVVYELAQQQRDRGHTVAVFAGERGISLRETRLRHDRVDGIEVDRLFFSPRSDQAWLNHPAPGKELRRVLKKFSPDIVHVHHLAGLSLSLLDALHELAVPTVMTLHDYSLLCARSVMFRGDGSFCTGSDLEQDCARCLADDSAYPKPGLVDWAVLAGKLAKSSSGWKRGAERVGQVLLGVKPLMRWRGVEILRERNRAVLERLDRLQLLLAPSEDLARRFETLAGFDRGRIHAIPLAVSLPERTGQAIPQGRPLRLGYVGKITPIKGLHVLVEALAGLPREYATLEVFGEPTWTDAREVAYWRSLRKRSRNLPVIFWGGFPHREVLRVMNRFHLLAVPSLCAESFGRMVQEAFAAGVPVLCSNVGGVVDQVEHGVSGLHIPVGDISAWKHKLRALCEDSNLLSRLREGVPAPNDLIRYVEQVEAEYRDVLASRGGETQR